MKGLVAFSLFGDRPMYTQGAIKNARIWQGSPFDLDLVYYVGRSVPNAILAELDHYGAHIEFADGPENQTATFWRFDAITIPNYSYYLFRDVDSRPRSREFTAIQEWLDSGYGYHVMRDHPYHSVPILAGLWGAKADSLGVIADRMPMTPPEKFYEKASCVVPGRTWKSNDFYQVDQIWLMSEVYPKIRQFTLAHDEFFSYERRARRRRFPTRIGLEFVGEGFDECDKPRFPEHRKLIETWPKTDPAYL